MNNNHSENLMQSIDTVVQHKLNSVHFDITEICTVIQENDDNYLVSNEAGLSFYAGTTGNNRYSQGQRVYVLIPQGDYSGNKLIVGEYDNKGETGRDNLVYTSPFEHLVKRNIVNGDCSELVVAAEASQEVESQIASNLEFTKSGFGEFDYIGLEFTATTGFSWTNGAFYLRPQFYDSSGSNGLLSEEQQNVLTFSSKQILGNPYYLIPKINIQHLFYFPKDFDITKVAKIKFTLYTDDDFEYEGSQQYITINSLNLYFGYDTNNENLEQDKIVLTLINTDNFEYTTIQNAKTMSLEFCDLENRKIYNDKLDEINYDVYWLQNSMYDNYQKNQTSDISESGVYWKTIAGPSLGDEDPIYKLTLSPNINWPSEDIKIGVRKQETIEGQQVTTFYKESNILHFTNTNYVIAPATLNQINRGITFKLEENDDGIYNEYGIDNKLLKKNEAHTITANLANGQWDLNVQHTLWRIPKNGSMLRVPQLYDSSSHKYVNDPSWYDGDDNDQSWPDWITNEDRLHYYVNLFGSQTISYQLNDQFQYSKNNNTIDCKVINTKTNTTFYGAFRFQFGTQGTSGTGYAFNIYPDTPDGLIINGNNEITFTAKLETNDGIPIDLSNTDVKWEYISNGVEYESLEPYLELNQNDNTVRIKSGVNKNTLKGKFYIPKKLGNNIIQGIDEEGFKDCVYIEEIIIPDNITSIADYAFCSCHALKNITIPNSVDQIGKGAFLDCACLEKISLPFVGQEDGYTYSGDGDSTKLFGYIFQKDDGYNIPNLCQTINQRYVKGSSDTTISAYLPVNLKTVIITNCTTLPYSAFDNCTTLKEIKIVSDKIVENGVETAIFRNCNNLKKIELSPNITKITSYMFEGSGLEDFTIPYGITNIDYGAFKNCVQLRNLVIPESVTQILGTNGNNSAALYGCYNLHSLTIPFTGKAIYNSAATDTHEYMFGYIFGNQQPNNSGNIIEPEAGEQPPWHGSYPDERLDGSIEYENYIAVLQPYRLVVQEQDQKQNEYTLENGIITGIGHRNELSRYYIPKTLKNISIKGCTFIPTYAFARCRMIEEVQIADTVTEVGNTVFSECTELNSIRLSNSLKTITSYMFERCNLEEVYVPRSITKVYKTAFAWLTIPTSDPVEIYLCAENTNNLTTIEEPDIQINPYTTDDEYIVAHLKEGSIYNINPNNGFLNPPFNITINIEEINLNNFYEIDQSGTLSFLKIGNDRKPIFGKVIIPNQVNNANVIKLADCFFQNCYNIEEIEISEGIEEIGNYAFENCTNLKNIKLPSTLTTIGNLAFKNCSNLKEITIPSNIVVIHQNIFNNCINLENIYDLDKTSIELIGIGVFANCYSLKEIKMPNTIKQIAPEAFKSCYSLKKIIIPENLERTIYPTAPLIADNAFAECINLQTFQINVSESKNQPYLPYEPFNISSLYSLKTIEYDSNFNPIINYSQLNQNIYFKSIYGITKDQYKVSVKDVIGLGHKLDYLILKASTSMNNIILEAYYPIPSWATDAYGFFITGPSQVTYDFQGLAPNYIEQIPYELFQRVINQETEEQEIEKVTTVEKWEIETYRNDDFSPTLKIENEKYYLVPTQNLPTELPQCSLIAYGENNEILYRQPILMLKNQYSFSLLNQWDELTYQDDNKILSQMIGAGSKNANNQYTGVLLGDISMAGGDATTGLYGFQDGILRYKLDEYGSFYVGTGNDNFISFNENIGGRSQNNELLIKINNFELITPNLDISSSNKSIKIYSDTTTASNKPDRLKVFLGEIKEDTYGLDIYDGAFRLYDHAAALDENGYSTLSNTDASLWFEDGALYINGRLQRSSDTSKTSIKFGDFEGSLIIDQQAQKYNATNSILKFETEYGNNYPSLNIGIYGHTNGMQGINASGCITYYDPDGNSNTPLSITSGYSQSTNTTNGKKLILQAGNFNTGITYGYSQIILTGGGNGGPKIFLKNIRDMRSGGTYTSGEIVVTVGGYLMLDNQ